MVTSDDCNVAGYGVIQSHKHLNMLWVSGQVRDDNMTGPGAPCVTGKLTCLAQISTKIIHCTEDCRGHVCAIPRAPGHVWRQLDAITPAGSTGRSALVS